MSARPLAASCHHRHRRPHPPPLSPQPPRVCSDTLEPRLVEMYTQVSQLDVRVAPRAVPSILIWAGILQVGQYLSRYTSGKVPKAFKIIPSLKNWEEVPAHRGGLLVSLARRTTRLGALRCSL